MSGDYEDHNKETAQERDVWLRDHFAGLAMQAIISRDDCRNRDSLAIYADAYKTADAMLKARSVCQK